MPDYVTKDSGERREFSTGMQRDTTAGKERFDLIMPLDVPYDEQMLTRWARLMARGASKYSERNWELASTQGELDRFRESALRHMMQWILSADDEEDHASAILFNVAGAELVKWKMRNDLR